MSNKVTVMAQYDAAGGLYQRFAQDMEYLLKRILQDEGITYNAITSRLKDRDSLSKKIDRKNDKYRDLTELTDIAGIRVIAYYADDVDKIAAIVEKEFSVDRENSIDKRMSLEPDRFGYCSVHYVVSLSDSRLKLKEYKVYRGMKCEIQIRSVLQHAWAEIEHDLGYKSEIAVPREIRRNFSRLAGLLELADKEFQDIREKLTSYKMEAETKISKDSYFNEYLDAIILDALITSNSDVEDINHEISQCLHTEICERVDDFEYYGEIIHSLHWLNIFTLGQALELITQNKTTAVAIAKEVATRSDQPLDGQPLSCGIAFFYLCYAELLRRHDEADMIMSYLEHGGIGDTLERDVIVEELLEIRKIVYP